jgi:N-acyl-D-aspartate/D-glutamate deacylase
MMAEKSLIKGGTVVDGTGKPPYSADVRIDGETIVEIAPGLAAQAGERVIDAAGCYVTPGFIESHTHFDAPMWWQPDLDPLPGHGVTTIISGNCGFSAAPVSKDPESRKEMVRIFSFFEDIPEAPFEKLLPWDWLKWSEYRRSVEEKIKLPANFATYVGHIAIRVAVMGRAAWDRVATPDEIARMAELLDDALAAGALGMSDNMLDHDGNNRPIPTLVNDDAELTALFDVLQRYPGASYQLIIDNIMRKTGPEAVKRIERLMKGRPIRLLINNGVPTLDLQKEARGILEPMVDRMRAEGFDLWTSVPHVAPTVTLSFYRSLMFAQSNDYAWHEVVLAPTHEEKVKLLSDPEWRTRARDSWDNKAWKHSPMNNPQDLHLLDSENGTGPIGITLKDYADRMGKHRSDAMADWLLANGTRSTIHMSPFPKDEDLTVHLMTREKTVGAVSDAGAHQQMLCGGGETTLLLTRYVRDEGRMTIEQAIHVLTGKLAAFFGLEDRGTLAPGKRADIAVFNLAEIERRPMEKRYDVPDGAGGISWRFTRAPAPMRHTIVNGVETFDGRKFTGAMPGAFLSPADAPIAYDLAAE